MDNYIHRVQYYETDKMGITHNSNYIRWMEEARLYFLEQIGWNFEKFADAGFASPVVNVSCDFKSPTTFNDRVEISVEIIEYRGVRLKVYYEMKNLKTGKIAATGMSVHCFVNSEGKPVILKHHFPDFDAAMKKHTKA